MKPRLSLIDRARRALAKARGENEPQPTLPPSPFAEWDYERAAAAIDEALAAQTIDTSGNTTEITTAAGEARFSAPRRNQNPIAINRAFYQGDHWQNGSGYIGPHPQPNDAGFTEAMTEIANIFTSQNAVAEVTDRHKLGVVGKPFRWGFVPRRETGEQKATTAEQTLIDEATAFMRDWMLARKVPTLIRNAVATLLLAERSAIRLTIPAGLTTKNAAGETVVAVSNKSITEALAKIWPEHPTPEDSVVVSDGDTKLEAGVVLFEGVRDDDNDTRDDDDKPEDFAWLCFLDRVGETVIRILGAKDEPVSVGAAETDDVLAEEFAALEQSVAARENETPLSQSRLALGGRLPMFEMHRSALATPQVQQNQRALDFALTMVPRNVTTGGFVERLLMDARAPGEPEIVNGVKTGKWIEKPFYVGAGTTNIIEGAEYEETNDQGEKVVRHGSPSAVFRDPVKPDASLTAKDAHYRAILSEVGQMHVLISGDATASAVARIQARAEYLNTLLVTQPEVEAALRWLLETALAMAEAIAETPGKYTNVLRAEVTCKLDTGPVTPEERKAIEESIGKTISQETAMLMLGVDDVDAEKTRMAADPQAQAAAKKAIGEALMALTGAGATLEGAAKFLGLEGDDLKNLLTADTGTAGAPAAQNGAPPTAPSTATGDGQDGDSGDGQPSDEAKPGSTSGSAPGGQAGE